MSTIARIFAAFVLVALFAAIVVGFFYGGYRIIRKQDWSALLPFVLGLPLGIAIAGWMGALPPEPEL